MKRLKINPSYGKIAGMEMENEISALESSARSASHAHQAPEMIGPADPVAELHFEWNVMITGGPDAFAANPNWDSPDTTNS